MGDDATDDFISKTVSEVETFAGGPPSGEYENRDGIRSYLNIGMRTTELSYAENPWLAHDDRGPRCEAVLIGIRYGTSYSRPTIVVSPFGKDVHSHEMNADEAQDYAEAILHYVEHIRRMEKASVS
jgi:hypothetical protein